jgi:protein ImuB
MSGASAPRTACLLIPNLPLAAELRAHPELGGKPLAVASGPGPRAELIAVSEEAARRGVLGQTRVAHARAVCAELIVRIASPALETAARAALLDAALSVSPRAHEAPRSAGAFAAEAAVYLDASGVDALFHSEAGFAAALCARAQRLGLPGNVAIASSRQVARIAARRLAGPGETCLLAPGREAAFLAPLPIDSLDPADALAEALTRFGVYSVSDLLALPRRALRSRLGPEVMRLVELAEGRGDDTPLPVPQSARLCEAIDLEFPIARLEPLAFVVQGLLSRLLARLEARHLACGDLAITLQQEDGARDARRIGSAAPTLDLRVLVRLVCHALESQPPQAAVEGVRLETEGRPIQSDQLDLFRPAGPAPAALGRTLAELEALCGGDRIGSPRVADHPHPDALQMAPFQPGTAQTPRPSPGPRAGNLAIHTPHASPGPRAGQLAIRALRPPLAASVRVCQGLPEHVRSAIANGRVLQVAGPWRTTGSWWSREDHFAFDSFDVQTADGTVARLRFDHLRKHWQIDAVYD